MEWILGPYRKLYPAIAGRSSRKEFWLFFLHVVAVMVIFVALFASVMGGIVYNASNGNAPGAGTFGAMGLMFVLMIPFGLWAYLTFPALIALQCRRLHDQDRSAWLMLIGLIPYLGWFIMLIFMCISGTPGSNRWGADPRDGEHGADVFA